jgi:integrase
MPRRAKGPRLHLRPARADRAPVWVILDRGKETSTGCSESDVEGSERALAAYLTDKYEPPKTGGSLRKTLIADVVNVYIKERAPKTARPDFILGNAEPILEWWPEKYPYLSDIRARSCDEYVDWRTVQPRKRRHDGFVSKQTARHELKMLSTAIQYYHANYGPLDAIPVVTLPPASKKRESYWLTRKMVAERLRVARRLPKCGHVVRLLIAGIYSGSRPGATKSLRWIPAIDGGWIDLGSETIHRQSEDETETNKRKTKQRIHRRLLPWLKRWYQQDMVVGVKRRVRRGGSRHKVTMPCTYLIHYGGKPITKVRRAWHTVAIAAGHATKVLRNGKEYWKVPDGPHICRHTAATWMMQSGVPTAEGAGYLGMSEKTYVEVYGHHHPDFQQNASSHGGRRLKTVTPMRRP